MPWHWEDGWTKGYLAFGVGLAIWGLVLLVRGGTPLLWGSAIGAGAICVLYALVAAWPTKPE